MCRMLKFLPAIKTGSTSPIFMFIHLSHLVNILTEVAWFYKVRLYLTVTLLGGFFIAVPLDIDSFSRERIFTLKGTHR